MKPFSVVAGLLGAALLSGCGTMAFTDAKSNVAEDKVVYHVNDSKEQAVNALRNIANHLEVNPKAKVEGLKERGVTFDVCEITLRNRQLPKSKFIPEAVFVPSGVAEITRLQQREGYAYLRP
jgi:intracellular sulfur oxidation DsrE/DsrF family protein